MQSNLIYQQICFLGNDKEVAEPTTQLTAQCLLLLPGGADDAASTLLSLNVTPNLATKGCFDCVELVVGVAVRRVESDWTPDAELPAASVRLNGS